MRFAQLQWKELRVITLTGSKTQSFLGSCVSDKEMLGSVGVPELWILNTSGEALSDALCLECGLNWWEAGLTAE